MDDKPLKHWASHRLQVEDVAAHIQRRAIRQARLMQDTFDFFQAK